MAEPLLAGAQPKLVFWGRGGFGKLGYLNIHFVKNTIKNTERKILEFLFLNSVRTF